MPSFKLVVYVPVTHADSVREVMGGAGGGMIGNYSHCSFSSRGVGRFLPGSGAQPFTGEVGKLEVVEEERIEMTVGEDVLDSVITAMRKVHPYEEVAFDVYRLESR